MEQKIDLSQIDHEMTWSQIRETVLMLNLAVAQIEMSMKDGDQSVNTLIDSFTTMSGSIQVIELAAKDLPDDSSDGTPDAGYLSRIRDVITSNSEMVSLKMQEAIVAFQFYDKLTQRLSHVSSSLSALAVLVSDPQKIYSIYEWQGLQEKIRATYSMEDEQQMFKAILSGSSVTEALELMHSEMRVRIENEDESGEDVELF